MNRIKRTIIQAVPAGAFLLICLIVFGPIHVFGNDLMVGDPAPKIYAQEWMNGSEVTAFEPGTIYVIECWASWCGPCKKVIPHVNKLHDEYADKGVVFIGLNISDTPEKAKAFVEEMGDGMQYRVAIDDGWKSGEAWLKAAGVSGIPHAFVVDGKGRLVWMGHPARGLDNVLEQLQLGEYNPARQIEDAIRIKNSALALELLDNQLTENYRQQDWDAAVATVDKMIEAVGEEGTAANRYRVQKFKIVFLHQQDFTSCVPLVEQLLTGPLKEDKEYLLQMLQSANTDKTKERAYLVELVNGPLDGDPASIGKEVAEKVAVLQRKEQEKRLIAYRIGCHLCKLDGVDSEAFFIHAQTCCKLGYLQEAVAVQEKLLASADPETTNYELFKRDLEKFKASADKIN